MKKVLSISITSSIIIFLLAYYYQYHILLSNQPVFDVSGKIVNQNFTSLPPSSAWIFALPVACVSLVVISLLLFILLKNK